MGLDSDELSAMGKSLSCSGRCGGVHWSAMKISTNSVKTVERLFGQCDKRIWNKSRVLTEDEAAIGAALFGSSEVLSTIGTASDDDGDGLWQGAMIVEAAPRSQYDTLIELGRSGVALPDGLICLAGRGDGFHGFKGRSWASPPGNIYLSAHLAPNRKIVNFGAGFLMLAAVSVIEALDAVEILNRRAMIKWVNDILIDGAKICGVLASTSTQGERVTGAVIGIGLNVMTTPEVPPTRFVPRVASLRDFCDRPDDTLLSAALRQLIIALEKNYRLLLSDGCDPLFEKYHARSMVLGHEVAIHEDSTDDDGKLIVQGKVMGMNERLELDIAGRDGLVSSGRLVLKAE
jgi:BirA family biotin operon repressor/biotin-[acetyl-CoA-carboxylase] ligase